MNGWARAVLVTVSLVPYVYFGVRDLLHHKEHRKIPLGERLLHMTLGTLLLAIIPHACVGHWDVVIPGVVLFTVTRSIDEFIFHRALAPAEVDLHAKTHLGFLIFVVGIIAVGWLDERKLWP